jgi:hypothetical protein
MGKGYHVGALLMNLAPAPDETPDRQVLDEGEAANDRGLGDPVNGGKWGKRAHISG